MDGQGPGEWLGVYTYISQRLDNIFLQEWRRRGQKKVKTGIGLILCQSLSCGHHASILEWREFQSSLFG